jgi:hypothetical protein
LLFKSKCLNIKKHWLFFATDKIIKTGRVSNLPESPKQIKGLRLIKSIVDRIFYENALFVYFGQ